MKQTNYDFHLCSVSYLLKTFTPPFVHSICSLVCTVWCPHELKLFLVDLGSEDLTMDVIRCKVILSINSSSIFLLYENEDDCICYHFEKCNCANKVSWLKILELFWVVWMLVGSLEGNCFLGNGSSKRDWRFCWGCLYNYIICHIIGRWPTYIRSIYVAHFFGKCGSNLTKTHVEIKNIIK